jgi:hypothetical protein
LLLFIVFCLAQNLIHCPESQVNINEYHHEIESQNVVQKVNSTRGAMRTLAQNQVLGQKIGARSFSRKMKGGMQNERGMEDKEMTRQGFEPRTFRSGVERATVAPPRHRLLSVDAP